MPGSQSPSRGGRCGSRSTRAHRSPHTSQAPSQSPRRRRTSKGRAAREPRLRAVPEAARAAVRLGGRAGRVERGASRPRSVGAGHPLLARGHVRESVSHCLPPAGLGARNLPAVPPPLGSPPCRGAPRDSRVTRSPSSTPSTCGELGALYPSGRSHDILPSPRNPVPRLPGTQACRWKNSPNSAPPKLGVGEPTLSAVVQTEKPTLFPQVPRVCSWPLWPALPLWGAFPSFAALGTLDYD